LTPPLILETKFASYHLLIYIDRTNLYENLKEDILWQILK